MNAFHASLLDAPLLFSESWTQQALTFFHQLIKQAEATPQPTGPVATKVQLVENVSGRGPQMARLSDYVMGQSSPIASDSVAIVYLTGPLIRYTYWMPSTEYYRQLIESLLAMPEIKGIVLVTDSPGGQAAGIAGLYDVIAQAEKPIIALVNGLAASAGYYAIAGAAEIWASQPSDQIGSIGAYISLLDASAYYSQMGIKFIDIYARVSGEKNLPSRAALSGDLAPMQDMLDELVGYFHAAVRTGRGDSLSEESATTAFAGAVYFAGKAKELGLIDQVGTLKQAVARVYELADTGWTNPNAGPPRTSQSSSFSTNSESADMGLLDKQPLITALRGVATDAITETQVDAINTSLEQQGIPLAVLSTADVTRLEGFETANAKLTEENTRLSGEVTRLGAQPGEKPSEPVKETENTPAPSAGTTDPNPYYSQTDADLAQIKKLKKA